MLKGYRNIQTGDLIVMWSSLVDTNHSDTQRFINLNKVYTYDSELEEENAKNINSLHQYFKESDSLDQVFPIIRRNASVKVGNTSDGAFIVYGLTEGDAQQILSQQVLNVVDGELYSKEGICINKNKAETLELSVNDPVIVCAKTQTGEMNYYETKVSGIYDGGAFYDTYYAFTGFDLAKEMFMIKDEYFDVMKVFVKDRSRVEEIGHEMNEVLDTDVMAVENYMEANTFYTTMPSVIKMVCTFFTLFLLVLIGIGLRSTIRINLVQRMKEFGTLRAIGFSRMQTYGVIFNETFIISLFSFLTALLVEIILTIVIGMKGIYVGEAMSTVFGSERLFPYLQFLDVIETFVIIIVFSLLATLKPGLQLCYQNITNVLAKRQEKISVIKGMILDR